ncbi:MAG: helix-turn-helix domain-containing protein [Alphaproteobacteria bacterium]
MTFTGLLVSVAEWNPCELGGLVLAYFPNVAGDAFPHGLLYETPSYTSIYSIHIRQIVEHCVVSAFDVSREALYAPGRSHAKTALARQVAMYLTHVVFGLTLTEVGELFQRDRTTVAHGCSVVEDLRDNPDMDRVLTIFETALASLMHEKTQENA